MAKTVKIQVTNPKNEMFHPVLRKPVGLRPRTLLVHDPRGSCIEGDVVNVQGGLRASKTVRHVVTRIVAPFGGVAVAKRPAVLTPDEKRNYKADQTRAKLERRAERRRAVEEGDREGKREEGKEAGMEVPGKKGDRADVKAGKTERGKGKGEKGGDGSGAASSRKESKETNERDERDEMRNENGVGLGRKREEEATKTSSGKEGKENAKSKPWWSLESIKKNITGGGRS